MSGNWTSNNTQRVGPRGFLATQFLSHSTTKTGDWSKITMEGNGGVCVKVVSTLPASLFQTSITTLKKKNPFRTWSFPITMLMSIEETFHPSIVLFHFILMSVIKKNQPADNFFCLLMKQEINWLVSACWVLLPSPIRNYSHFLKK